MMPTLNTLLSAGMMGILYLQYFSTKPHFDPLSFADCTTLTNKPKDKMKVFILWENLVSK